MTVAQLAAAQDAAGRPLRFDEYLAIVLYGEHGFYTTSGQAGRRGDFITSPEVGPLFAAVLARWIDAEHARLGAPDDFTIVEVGAGPGTLARAILLAAPHWIERYVAVEISPTQRAQHPAGVRSQAELPSVPFRGVVIANELLDNLPFRLAVFDGGWREALVSIAGDGTASELLVAAPPEWSWLPIDAAHGARLPVQHATGAWVRDVGLQDITAQVCLDQLPATKAVRTQAQFLQRWGIEELVEEGRTAWAAAAGAPNLAALRMRSRLREAESLLDIDGLGGFLALEW